MSRHSRERSVRTDPSLNEGTRPVQLTESRRFFTAQGNQDGVRGARALQNFIGIGADAVSGLLDRSNVKGASKAALESAGGDPRDPDIKNKGYNEAYDKIEAINDLAIFRSELPALITKEGWMDLQPAAFQARVHEYYAGQLEGINPDSVYSNIITAGIEDQEAQLLVSNIAFFDDKVLQERRIDIRDAIRAEYDEDGTVDHKQAMKWLGDFAPGPGGRATYIEIMLDLGKDMGDVAVIDSIPDFFPGGDPTGKNDPNMEQDFDDARTKALALFDKRKKAADDKFKLDNQTTRAQAHSDLTQRALAGDATVITDIYAGGEDGPDGEPRLLLRGPQKTLIDQLHTAQAASAVSGVDADLFGTLRAYGMSTTDYDNAAAGYAARTAERYRTEFPEWNDQQVEAETLKLVIAQSHGNDRIPKFINDMIDASPSNPERFKQAVAVKAMLDAHNPELFQRSVSDRNAALMGAYEFSLIDTGSDQAAMDFVAQYDETRMEGRKGDVADIADLALDVLAGDSGFWSADYAITRRDRVRARALGEHYINLGFGDERVASFIETGMRERNVRVGGVMYPTDFGWVKGTEAAEAYMRVTPGNEFFTESENLVMKPSKHGFVTISDSTSVLPGSLLEVRVSEIEKWYAKSQDDQLIALAAGAESGVDERFKEAEDRAYAATYPPRVWGVEGNAVAYAFSSRAAWKAMDPDQRKRLIEAQLKQVDSATPYRSYSDEDFDINGEFIRNPLFMAGPNAINAQAKP